MQSEQLDPGAYRTDRQCAIVERRAPLLLLRWHGVQLGRLGRLDTGTARCGGGRRCAGAAARIQLLYH